MVWCVRIVYYFLDVRSVCEIKRKKRIGMMWGRYIRGRDLINLGGYIIFIFILL